MAALAHDGPVGPAGAKDATEAREQAPPAQLPLGPKATEEDAVEDALGRIWAGAHRRAIPKPGQWEAFRRGVLHAVADPIWLLPSSGLGQLKASGSLNVGVGPIEGPVSSVDLVVTADTAGERPAEWLMAYIRRRLAPTFARFESSGAGTPEQRVDILVRALAPMGGSELAARLVPDVARYLEGQGGPDRGVGYYVTLASVGQLLDAGDHPRRRQVALAIFHRVLKGCRDLAASPAPPGDPPRRFGTVPVTAHNVAGLIAQELQENRVEAGPDGRAALQALATIAVVSSDLLVIEPGRAGQVVGALGLQGVDPVAVLSVIARAGALGDAWAPAHIERAWLEAAGAVVLAESSPGRRIPARLFNAGISVRRAAVDDDAHLRARILLNSLGLHWAFVLAEGKAYEALVELEGLDCAVNLLPALGTARARGLALPGEADRMMEGLARLARWPALATLPDQRFREDVGRITGSARAFGVDLEQPFDPEGAASLVAQALAALAPDTGLDSGTDLVVASGRIVTHVFVDELGLAPGALGALVADAVQLRGDPTRALVERYEPYANQAGGAGAAVLNEAGLTSPESWVQLEAELLQPLEAIAPALGALSTE